MRHATITKTNNMARSSGTQKESLLDNYVFMDKTLEALDVGMKTDKNVVLYGPGGHGKSEYSIEYLYEKDIAPYVITMGTGMTTDRLFGGLDVRTYEETGKIEYLVENSFMNHEYVIFEELMDAPDFILEQLKDILSSGQFRNGSQIFAIKTRFIVACTNKSREEFMKNPSLKALMERFPLEHQVVWDNYNEASYLTLLEKRFGAGTIDPVIPYLLQEYSRNNIVISPRIALDCYEVYEVCGPNALAFIADFARKPTLIKEALSKFEKTIRFKQLGAEIEELVTEMKSTKNIAKEQKEAFIANFNKLKTKHSEVKHMTINDDIAQQHAALLVATNEAIDSLKERYNEAQKKLKQLEAKKVESNIADVVGSLQGTPLV